ncbi:MucBP domain-containing protein [Carnobacterium divergens]|nr:MucBP domain-containing protein [Carnobacterium divergens]MDO0875393.1 MucBP domain-containing protein [Carnobacterium divergens]SUX16989.1 Internalin-J precursor [Carnobacterium divergens]
MKRRSKKLFTIFGLGILILNGFLMLMTNTVVAEKIVDTASTEVIPIGENVLKKNNSVNSKLVASNKNTILSLPDNAISYTANATEYYLGDLYKGSIKISNSDGNVIEKGTTISIMLPVDGIDMTSIFLNDPQLQEFFTASLNKESGVLELTLKKQIVGNSTIDIKISGKITGIVDQSYDVSINATDFNGQESEVINNTPSFIVKENLNPPSYGFLNAFWGLGPNEVGNFFAKSDEDIEGLPTGIFYKNSFLVQNFTQINYGGNYKLPPNAHYKFAWSIEPFSGTGTTNIDTNDIRVFNDVTNIEIPKEWYTITLDPNESTKKVWIEFKSEEEIEKMGGEVDSQISYRIQLQAGVTDELTTYHSTAYNYIVTSSGVLIDETKFELNNIFSEDGNSELYPTLTVEDKTFYVNDLNDGNINTKLLENISAVDTIDGNITNQVIVDYSKLDPKISGDYEVTYSVKNSSGNTTIKKSIVHIIDRENAAPVTVKYIDDDGKDIIPQEQISGKIGDSYSTDSKIFDGYILNKTPDNAQGILKNEPQTVVYEYKGQLVFISAPSQINFGDHILSAKTENYFIESKVGDLVVEDFRSIGSTWTMSAQLMKDFVGKESNKALGSTLNFIDKDGNKEIISTKDKTQIISHSTDSHDEVNLSSEWIDNKVGLELEVPAGKALVDEYQAVIDWTLENGVPNS